MPIEIREHSPGKDIHDFVRFPYDLYRNDALWVPPLELDVRHRLTPSRNPFFRRGEVSLFTAWDGNRIVGRCSAQVDREHLRVHKDKTGFFGFLDTIDDPEVVKALLGAAEDWLRVRGMRVMRGPISLSINEEVGAQIEGFDSPPVFMMPYSRPYQSRLIEEAGLAKAKDLLAWRYEAGQIPERCLRAWEAVQAMPEVRMRRVDTSQMERELRVIMDVFNDAWSDNWGFVPATEDEVRRVAKDLRLIVEEDLAFVVEIDKQPAAICVALPNLNEAIRDLQGKLFPTGLLKLIWRLKVKNPGSARLMMLGIRKDIRKLKKYGALSMAMYVELHRRGTRRGYHWGELSWTLEDNAPINLGIRAMGARVYKKYRVYEKPIHVQTSVAPPVTAMNQNAWNARDGV